MDRRQRGVEKRLGICQLGCWGLGTGSIVKACMSGGVGEEGFGIVGIGVARPSSGKQTSGGDLIDDMLHQA